MTSDFTNLDFGQIFFLSCTFGPFHPPERMNLVLCLCWRYDVQTNGNQCDMDQAWTLTRLYCLSQIIHWRGYHIRRIPYEVEMPSVDICLWMDLWGMRNVVWFPPNREPAGNGSGALTKTYLWEFLVSWRQYISVQNSANCTCKKTYGINGVPFSGAVSLMEISRWIETAPTENYPCLSFFLSSSPGACDDFCSLFATSGFSSRFHFNLLPSSNPLSTCFPIDANTQNSWQSQKRQSQCSCLPTSKLLA